MLEARFPPVQPPGAENTNSGSAPAPVNSRSPAAEKIALFRSLFRGRDDVYSKRFESRRTGLELAEEASISLTYWHVMDSGKDSVDLLKKLLDRFGARLNYVVVHNQLRGDNFDLFDQSGAREQLTELGSPVITLKRLHEPVINKIDAGSTSFWAAKHRSETEGKGLGILERQRAKMWLNSAYAELERAGV